MSKMRRQRKIVDWLRVAKQKIRKLNASPEARKAVRDWGNAQGGVNDPKIRMEEYRQRMRIESNPVDKAIYKRLFRMARNVSNG